MRPIPNTAMSMTSPTARPEPDFKPDRSVDVVELEKLSDGVWAWLQPGGGSGISNAGVVADDDGLTVIDCLMVRSQWEPFAAAVAELGQPVRRAGRARTRPDPGWGAEALSPAPLLPPPAAPAVLA